MEMVTVKDSRPTPDQSTVDSTPPGIVDVAVTRRGFPGGVALAGTGLVGTTVAACAAARRS